MGADITWPLISHSWDVAAPERTILPILSVVPRMTAIEITYFDVETVSSLDDVSEF